MALVTVQRSPSPSNVAESEPSDEVDPAKSPTRQRRSRGALKKLRKLFHTLRFVNKLRFSESYFAVKGAAMILPQLEGRKSIAKGSHGGDIQNHLQAMFYLLRPQDTIKVAVKLESLFPDRNRYLVMVSTNGRQDTEESLVLGIDCMDKATVGLVLPIWADTKVSLDGDGGFSVTSNDKHHIFKPVSVQALWSALQCLHKANEVALQHTYYPQGLTHTWVGYYESIVQSERSCLSEWHAMEDIDFTRPNSPLVYFGEDKNDLERDIKIKLREIMLTVDLEEVTSRYLRLRLEEELGQNLKDYRGFIDEHCLIIMGQLDAPSKIFDYLYLGSEWNASNLEELKKNGIGYILNISREIDNFFPGVFEYYNIRVFDVEESDLLRYWEKTYKFISKAKNSGSKCLVHCRMGISRSSSTVIAFSMKEYGWSLEEALKYVQKKRSIANPNPGFLHQLEIYQGILDASKQRHNSLWRSKSENNLNNLSLRCRDEDDEEDEEEEIELEMPGAESSFLQVPSPLSKSWSHDEKNSSLILRDQQYPEALDAKDLDRLNLAKFEMDVELSSRSADSMDEVFPDVPSPTTAGPSGSESFKIGAESESKRRSLPQGASDSSDSDMSSDSSLETDDSSVSGDSDVSEEGATGLYQVASVHATSMSAKQKPAQKTHKKMIGDIPENRRCSVETQGKNQQQQSPVKRVKSLPNLVELRRRLKRPLQLSLATRPLQSASVRPDDSWIKATPETPEADSNERPIFQASPHEKKEDAAVDDVDEDDVSSISVSITDSDITPPNAGEDKSDLSSDSEEEEDISENTEIKASNETKVDPAPAIVNPDAGALYHYEKEQIPWNLGAVRKQRQVIEESSGRHSSVSSDSGSNSRRSSLSGSKEKLVKIDIVIDEPEFSNNFASKAAEKQDNKDVSVGEIGSDKTVGHKSSVDRNTVGQTKPEVQKSSDKKPVKQTDLQVVAVVTSSDTVQSLEASTQLPEGKSVYEEEEIDLTPGLVKKTTQEIEEKYGSLSYNVTALSLASGKRGLSADFPNTPAKGVQRSSSLRVQRVTPRVALDKKRRTYSPILTPGKAQQEVQDNPPQSCADSNDIRADTPNAGLTAQSSGMKDEASLSILKIGQEEVPLEPGLVKKQTTDYESLSSEASQKLVQVSPLPTETADETLMENPRPVLGSVRKQREEIEKKYGVVSAPDVQPKASTPVEEVVLPAYKQLEEDIPWAVGTVKQHKEALENISKVAAGQGTSALNKANSVSEANSRYKMNKETLGLIRAIGKHLSDSPPEKPENKVKKVTRNIELKWGIYKKNGGFVKSLKAPAAGSCEKGGGSDGVVGAEIPDTSQDQPPHTPFTKGAVQKSGNLTTDKLTPDTVPQSTVGTSIGGLPLKEPAGPPVIGKKQLIQSCKKDDEDESEQTMESDSTRTPVTVKNLVGKFEVPCSDTDMHGSTTPDISSSAGLSDISKGKVEAAGGKVEVTRIALPRSRDQTNIQSPKESTPTPIPITEEKSNREIKKADTARSKSPRPASLATAIPYKKAAGVISPVRQRPKSCSDEGNSHEFSLTPTAGTSPQLASALKKSEDFAQCPWKKEKKFQGRSHPLTKLAEQQNIRNNAFYSTM